MTRRDLRDAWQIARGELRDDRPPFLVLAVAVVIGWWLAGRRRG